MSERFSLLFNLYDQISNLPNISTLSIELNNGKIIKGWENMFNHTSILIQDGDDIIPTSGINILDSIEDILEFSNKIKVICNNE